MKASFRNSSYEGFPILGVPSGGTYDRSIVYWDPYFGVPLFKEPTI